MSYDGRRIFRFEQDKLAQYEKLARFYGTKLSGLIRMLLDREVENTKKQQKEKKK